MICKECGQPIEEGAIECKCMSLITPEQKHCGQMSNKDKKFQEILNKSSYHGIGFDWLQVPRYQHVERIENEEVELILNGKVTVQPKIDGANLSVWWDGGLVVASRNRIIYKKGMTPTGFNGAIEFCIGHSGIKNLAGKYILRGEWLVRHTITYPQKAYKKFYVFDVQEYDTMKYIDPEDYVSELIYNSVEYVPTLIQLENPTLKEIHGFLDGPDFLGAPQKEGIVIKNYDYTNKYGKVKWGKIVCASFKERNKAIFGPSSKKDVEALFAKEIDYNLVWKTIEKIAHEQDRAVERKDIPQILGRVWYDIFTENLWNFVKKNKVSEFNFKASQRYAYVRTREFTLDYFENQLKEKMKDE